MFKRPQYKILGAVQLLYTYLCKSATCLRGLLIVRKLFGLVLFVSIVRKNSHVCSLYSLAHLCWRMMLQLSLRNYTLPKTNSLTKYQLPRRRYTPAGIYTGSCHSVTHSFLYQISKIYHYKCVVASELAHRKQFS